MEFAEKLQQLRKQAGLTQDQLAMKLFVSRTAVSKWETGNGYPNLDSLKDIAKVYGVSIDELLSNDELIHLAEGEKRLGIVRMLTIVFGILDIALLVFFVIPLFGEQNDTGFIEMVSLLSYDGPNYFLFPFSIAIILLTITGLVELYAVFSKNVKLCKWTCMCSIAIHTIAVLAFLMTQQPYATVFLFVFLIIKFVLIILQNSK